MFKYAFLLIAALFSSRAAAEEPYEAHDAYVELRKSTQASLDATADEVITATIKRSMAKLLYPVDLSSFESPVKDARFSRLIKVLQGQMGDAETGQLTMDQFGRLFDAAEAIDGLQIGLPNKIVSMDSGIVLALGTGVMGGLANPINKIRIVCQKTESICSETEASFDLKTRILGLYDPNVYQIQTWTRDRVTAVREHPCGTATMSIDLKAKTVQIGVLPHNGIQSCLGPPDGIWTLEDGFAVGWNIARENQIKATQLVYPPSKRLITILKPLNAK